MISSLSRIALATASFALVSSAAFAGDAVHAGSWTAQISKQEAHPLGSPDHVLVAQVWQGSNKSTGSEPVNDGGQVLISETVEMNKGNGPQHGQFAIADAKGSTTAQYEGQIATTMVDGKPHTTGKGTWRYVSATGAYQGASGGGGYSWTMSSPTEVSGEWNEDAASAQR